MAQTVMQLMCTVQYWLGGKLFKNVIIHKQKSLALGQWDSTYNIQLTQVRLNLELISVFKFPWRLV